MQRIFLFSILATLIAPIGACKTKFGGGPDPCDISNPNPVCGTQCQSDLDCGENHYCGLEQTCTADCTDGDNRCPENFVCGPNGRCIGNGVRPCDRSDPPTQCGNNCTDDDDCGPALYCGIGSVCTADCSAGDGNCGLGQMCGDHGRCVFDPDAGVGNDGPGCPSVVVDLAPVIPYVVMLIDQSGSMTDPFGGTDRWTAVDDALTDPTNGVVTLLEDRVRFGASLYTSFDGNLNGGQCPILQTVAADLGNLNPIDQLFANNVPEEDTPTGEAIDAVVVDMLALPTDPDGLPAPKILVVATDGLPDTCAEPDPQNGQAVSVAAAENAFANGITMFILSVGDQVGAAHLQDMANAGVGLPVGGATNAPFYVANSQQDMIDAFNEIIRGARECTFTLSSPIVLADADQGTVELNGTALVFGTDWQMIDTETMELLGTACDDFLNLDDVELVARFPCGVVVN